MPERDRSGPEPVLRFRAAHGRDADALSALAFRSKAHWGYSAEFMEACRAELSQPAEKIDSAAFQFELAEVDGAIAGFYALERLTAVEVELEALFVLPEHIGTGVGRALIERAKSRAADLGARSLVIQSDPHAEGFYRAAGGFVCERRESGSIPGRMLPVLRIALGHPTATAGTD